MSELSPEEFERRLEEYRKQCRAIVKEHGWGLQAVGGSIDKGYVPWTYTYGLTLFHHPELAMMTVHYSAAGHMLNDLGARIRDGQKFTAGQRIDDLMANGYVATLIEVRDMRDEYYPLSTAWQLFGDQATALQVVVPDKNHKYPWEQGYNHVGLPQPLLGPPPA